MANTRFETIIFDLGEVIVDLAYQRIVERMVQISSKDPKELMRLVSQSETLNDFETGKTSEEDFRHEMSIILGVELSMNSLVDTWNSMLDRINPLKLQLMQDLKKDHHVLILSNTNHLHVQKLDAMVSEIVPGASMADFAHTAHYSHELGFRKPDPTIYERMIELSKFDPSKSIFFDDKQENVQAALACGIYAEQVTYSDYVLDFFQSYSA